MDVTPPAPEPPPTPRTFIIELGADGKPIERFRGVAEWRGLAVRAASFTPVEDRERAAMRGAVKALIEHAPSENPLYLFFAASAMQLDGGSEALGRLFQRSTGWRPADGLVRLEMAIGELLCEAWGSEPLPPYRSTSRRELVNDPTQTEEAVE